MWNWHFLGRTLGFQAQTTGIRNLRTPDYLNQSIALPPLAEQRRIVDVIESVDDYINALETRAETARTARSALLHDLLSNPGPDWVETTLGDVVEVLDRFRRPISSSEREKRLGEVPYYGATGQTGWIDESIFDEELVLLGEDAIDFLNPKARKAYRISGPSWVNNHAHVLRPRPNVVLPGFLNESLNLVDYSQYTSYGTRSKLTQASMIQITLKIPSIEVQAKVEHLTLDIDRTIELQLQSLIAAADLRAALLSDLLSGNHAIPASYDQLLGAA
jgi:restriction endonuclease S subunit